MFHANFTVKNIVGRENFVGFLIVDIDLPQIGGAYEGTFIVKTCIMQIRPVVIYAEMLKIRPVYILLFLTYGLWAFTGLLWRLLCGKFGKTTVSCCDFFVVSDKICNFALTRGDSRSLFNTYALSRLCRGYSVWFPFLAIFNKPYTNL